MTASVLLDVAGRRRSPATLPGYHAGRVPHNKGQTYPADPPTVDEIVPVLRQAPDDRHGYRVRAMIVVLWRAGLCVSEVLALIETDLDERRGSLLVRRGKGGSRREVGMDAWGWEQLRPWLAARAELPIGALFCVIDGPTRGRAWSSVAVRLELHRLASEAGVRRRFAPHQLRHAHALELAREGALPGQDDPDRAGSLAARCPAPAMEMRGSALSLLDERQRRTRRYRVPCKAGARPPRPALPLPRGWAIRFAPPLRL